MPVVATHARYLLFPPRHQHRFARVSPVFESHCDPVLLHFFQKHSDRHLFKGLQFIQKSA
jgi:hypothetical protein